MLAKIASGIGWQGLGEIYRETIVARAPESITMALDLPARPWLELNVGTIEDEPVTFRISAVADSSGADPSPLVELKDLESRLIEAGASRLASDFETAQEPNAKETERRRALGYVR